MLITVLRQPMGALLRWLFSLCRPRRRSSGSGSPHSGQVVNRATQTTGGLVNHPDASSVETAPPPFASTPHSGSRATVGVLFLAHVNPQCGNQQLARAQLILASLSEGWWRAAQQKRSPRYCC